MQKLINYLICWFNSHWEHPWFRFFFIVGCIDIYMIVFHNHIYQQFINFIFLNAFPQLITNVINDKGLITGVGLALSGLIPFIFKKKKDNDN